MKDNIRTFEFKNLPLEIEVKDLSFIRDFSQLLGKHHKATFNQILWLEKGEATFSIDFREMLVHANEILIISAGQVCQFDITSQYSGKMILFTNNFFTITELDSNFLYSSEIFNPANLNVTTSISPVFMKNIITLLDNELKGNNANFQKEIAHSFLRVILFETERKHLSSQTIVISTIGRIFFNEVEKHFRENRDIKYYTTALGINEKKLSKEIKILTGKTPKVYIDSRIILEAKRLLTYSNLSIKEIGFELGFDEPTNFNKYFRKHIGNSPLKFRNSRS